jgi:hypothetical protein
VRVRYDERAEIVKLREGHKSHKTLLQHIESNCVEVKQVTIGPHNWHIVQRPHHRPPSKDMSNLIRWGAVRQEMTLAPRQHDDSDQQLFDRNAQQRADLSGPSFLSSPYPELMVSHAWK